MDGFPRWATALLWYAPRLANLLAFTMLLLSWPTLAGTWPGPFVVLAWRGQHQQRPRTNNSGAPICSDGRCCWRAAVAERQA